VIYPTKKKNARPKRRKAEPLGVGCWKGRRRRKGGFSSLFPPGEGGEKKKGGED